MKNRFFASIPLVAVLTLTFGVTALPQQSKSSKDTPAELIGTWDRTGVVIGKVPLPESSFAGQALVIDGNSFELVGSSSQPWAGTLKADAARTPKTIDLVFTTGRNAGKTWRGIYTVQRGVLRIRYVSNPDKPRPTSFTPGKSKGSGDFGDMDYGLDIYVRRQ